MEATRQMASTTSVKMMRDFSSGILKQFAKVLKMLLNMPWIRSAAPFTSFSRLRRDNFAGTAFAFNFCPRRGTEGVRSDGQFLREFPVAQNLDSCGLPVRQTGFAKLLQIHARPIAELIQGLEIHRII